MSQYKSGIAVKVNETEIAIKYLPLEDGRFEICEYFKLNLNDKTSCAFVELIPSKFDFNDLSCWKLCINDGYTEKPDWWTDSMSEQAKCQLIKAAKEDYNAYKEGNREVKSLCLNKFNELPKDFILPKVSWSLFLEGLTKVPKDFKPIVGGDLYMGSFKEASDGFSPTVAYNLHLRKLEKLPKDFNPTVGCNLYITSIDKIPDSVKLNVKGKIFLKGKKGESASENS